MTFHLVAALIAAALVALPPVAVHGAAVNSDSDHACSFFLWDVPSLIKYKLCEHLLRRNVYEARGGKKMVRIQYKHLLRVNPRGKPRQQRPRAVM